MVSYRLEPAHLSFVVPRAAEVVATEAQLQEGAAKNIASGKGGNEAQLQETYRCHTNVDGIGCIYAGINAAKYMSFPS